MDLDSLSDTQRETLSRYLAVTHDDDDVPRALQTLKACAWDLQMAVEARVNDGPRAVASTEGEMTPASTLYVGGPALASSSTSSAGLSLSPGYLLLWPFRLLLGAVHRILTWFIRFLRLVRVQPFDLLLQRPTFGTTVFARRLSPRRTVVEPTSCAERFVRRLEDETGGTRTGLQHGEQGRGETAAAAAAAAAAAGVGVGGSGIQLPRFLITSYGRALEQAKVSLRILMVILISDEHDNTLAFIRETLTSRDLIAFLEENGILVWGGSIADPEAFQVAETIDATTFPSVGFIALQPAPSSSSSSSIPGSASRMGDKMIMLARSEGPAVPDKTSRGPSSIIAPTSAPALIALLKSKVLIPAVTGHLNRLRREREDREAARVLRAEQDRAFAEAAQKDTERILKVREAERQKRLDAEAAARLETERAAAAAEAQRQLEEREREAQEAARARVAWLRSKAPLFPSETDLVASGKPLARIAFTLPNGKRILRKFAGDEPVLHMYIYAEARLAEIDLDDKADTVADTNGTDLQNFFYRPTFLLATTYPRTVIPISDARDRERRIDDLSAEGVWPGGANLVLEMATTQGT